MEAYEITCRLASRPGGFRPRLGRAALSVGFQIGGRVGPDLQAANKPGGRPGRLGTLVASRKVIFPGVSRSMFTYSARNYH